MIIVKASSMSIQACYRDQRKMGQVINQIRILANNLDELRAEIDALRMNYIKNNENPLYENNFQKSRNNKTDVLHKVKKYIKKVRSMYLVRKGQKSDKNQELYYTCSNLDSPLPTLLNYILHTDEKENAWQVPPKVKYVKSQGNQTSEKLENKGFTRKSPSISVNMENVKNIQHRRFPFTKHGNERYNIISSRKNATLVSTCSEISCELDLQVENPVFSPSASELNVFSDSYTFRNHPKNVEVLSEPSDNNKQSATKSTQTKIIQLGRKYKNLNFNYKHPNLCFSKIKNAVITKKIIRNSNESTFTVCGRTNNIKSYLCSRKERSKCCSCTTKRNNVNESNGREVNEESFPLSKLVTKRKSNSDVNNDNTFQNLFSEKISNLSSSSVSLDLEVNISNNSSKTEEFPERRKPRTYVIRKTTQKHNQDNWLNNFEKSVIYVEHTCSDLSLSSCSFSNHNIRFN